MGGQFSRRAHIQQGMINLPAAICKLVSSTLLAVFTAKFDDCDQDLHALGLSGGQFRAYYTTLICLIIFGYVLSLIGCVGTVHPDRDLQGAVSLFKAGMVLLYDVPKVITIVCLCSATDRTPGGLLMSSIIISAFSKLYSVIAGGWILSDNGDGRAGTVFATLGMCICCTSPIIFLI